MAPFNVRVGFGQESRRFLPSESSKPCVIAGVIFEEESGLGGDSDGDVVFLSICNAISSLCHVPILKGIAAELCYKNGITDSQVYVERALEICNHLQIQFVALNVEGKRPKLDDHSLAMREKVAQVLKLNVDQVGLTMTQADGLNDFGCGEGVRCFCVMTVSEK